MSVTYSYLAANTPVVLMAQNTDMIANMPEIITRAEDEVIGRIDHDAFKTVLAGPFMVSTANPIFDLSTQTNAVYEPRAVRLLPDLSVLEMREINRMSELYTPDDLGEPRFYAEDDQPFVYRVFPTPDAEYQLRIAANVTPARLSPAVDTSVLASRYPRVLTVAVYKHGAMFKRDRAAIELWEAALSGALVEANLQLARRRRDETGSAVKSTANITGDA